MFFYCIVELELEGIQERYVQVLRGFLQHSAPHNPGRLNDLLAHIPEVRLKHNNLDRGIGCNPCKSTYHTPTPSFVLTDPGGRESSARKQDVLRSFCIKLGQY